MRISQTRFNLGTVKVTTVSLHLPQYILQLMYCNLGLRKLTMRYDCRSHARDIRDIGANFCLIFGDEI